VNANIGSTAPTATRSWSAHGASKPNIHIGTDLITFFNPGYWDLPTNLPHESFEKIVDESPLSYFERMLDGCREAGLDGIELAPSPGGWTNALRAYGSAQGVGEALSSRGLKLGTSYQPSGHVIAEVLAGEVTTAEADDYVRRHAEFVAELGGEIIVMGTVPRLSLPEEDYESVSDSSMELVADHVNRLGAVAHEFGVVTALHTDAYSVCSRAPEIARMMNLTEPAFVKLCPDAGHISLDGGDAAEILAENVGRVPVMHWKDCAHPLDGRHLAGNGWQRHERMLKNFRVLGSGFVDWKRWQNVLKDAHWQGWAIAEIDMSPDPIGEIREGIRYFINELGPIYR